MSSVLVTHPYHLALDPREAALGRPYPPLQTLVAAAALRSAGHEVVVHDRMFAPDARGFGDALDRLRDPRGGRFDAVALVGDDHAVSMKQCLGAIRTATEQMLAACRDRGLPVIASGPDLSDHPEHYVAAGASAAVRGEVQRVLPAWIGGERDLVGVHGERGAGGRAAPLDDLDALAPAAWDLVDLRPYADTWRRRHGRWELNLWTARGCPYKCNWCAKPTWGRSYAVRDPDAVAAELVALMDRHRPDGLWFTDDIFALRRKWLAAFRRALDTRLQGRPPLPYRCLSRVDLLEDPAFTADLAATGCREVWVGAESGADSVLTAMDKDCTVAQIETATRLLRSHGIRTGFFLQLGYPGETLADVEATVAMVGRLKPDAIGVSVSYPLPGTPFHERVAPYLRDTHWQASMDNRPLFETPYEQPFYDAAKRVIQHQHAAAGGRRAARAFLDRPDRDRTRTLIAAVAHAAALPWARRRMRRAAVPNASAVPRSW
ncbi:MAG: B12-binding domain-containing radical SAM protein [Alphaproteobacteria bacterium]|nr:B12-binding domain-containing radical SAM protein [Alphaproteobacteria bacterium]